ncbi:MAG: SDR family NAD(P)-dependent oxidoreductase [Nitrososphaerales archaeon]
MGALQGKVAIVTGSASGIGHATAKLFAKAGASVFQVDIRYDAKSSLGKIETRFGADLTKNDQVKEAVAECIRRFHHLDIVVNCAGIEMPGTVIDLDESQFDRVLDTNLKSVFLVCKYSIPHLMRNRRGGSIINVSSDIGISPIPGSDAYAASKGAMIALTKAMSKNWAKNGVRINCIAPGPIDTPLLHRFVNKAMIRFVTGSLIPMGRLGQPEEVAKVALFLASDESSFVNGAVYTVNGGLV